MKNLLANKWLLIVFRVLLGGIFIAASISKIVDRSGFIDTVVDYGLLPEGLARFYGTVVPWLELYAGCSLVLGVFPRIAAGLSMAMVLSFIVASSYALVKSPGSPCGCFGTFIVLSHPVSLTIDAFMLVFALVLLFNRQPEFLTIGQLVDRINPYWKKNVKFCYYSSLLTVVAILMAGFALGSHGLNSISTFAGGAKQPDGIIIPEPLGGMVRSLLDKEKPVMLYVFAEGCAPCEESSPVIDTAAETYGTRLGYIKINYDEYTDQVTEMRVTVTPTLLFIVSRKADGTFGIFRKLTGRIEPSELSAVIDNTLEFVR